MANLGEQASAIWKALDEMMDKDPNAYQKFIHEQLAESEKFFKANTTNISSGFGISSSPPASGSSSAKVGKPGGVPATGRIGGGGGAGDERKKAGSSSSAKSNLPNFTIPTGFLPSIPARAGAKSGPFALASLLAGGEGGTRRAPAPPVAKAKAKPKKTPTPPPSNSLTDDIFTKSSIAALKIYDDDEEDADEDEEAKMKKLLLPTDKKQSTTSGKSKSSNRGTSKKPLIEEL